MMKKILSIFFFLSVSLNVGPIAEELPLAYQAYGWVNFCPHHLKTDPQCCSSWNYTVDTKWRKKYCPEEQNFVLFPFANISSKWIEDFQTAKGFQKLPTIPGSQCDWGTCMRCKKNLIRYVSWQEAIVEETQKCYRTASEATILYKCDCIDEFIDKNDAAFKKIVSNWKFCGEPACFSGYFDHQMCKYFSNFCSFVHYCNENSDCGCYWFEKSQFRKKVIDLIFERFWNEILKGKVSMDSNITIAPEIAAKLLLYPQRKFLEHMVHSFFYSELKTSLRSFNYKVLYRDFGDYWLDNPISHSEWTAFCDRLLPDLRSLYLEQYKICYGLHAHRKINKEIKAILNEINLINE